MGRIKLVLLATFLFVSDFAYGASTPVIYQTVSVAFRPQRAFLLVGNQAGQVRQFPAEMIIKAGTQELLEVVLGAEVPKALSGLGQTKMYFTFFLLGDESSFAATPVYSWTGNELAEKTEEAGVLQQRINQLRGRQELAKNQISKLEESLDELREQAAGVAGVDQIIDLKMKIARLDSYGEESGKEVERIESLVQRGRELQDPADVYDRVKVLSEHLREAAQVTAMADRLTERRRSAARAKLNRDLAVIQEMDRYSTQELAKEALRLRAKRKDLEGRREIEEEDIPF